MNKRIPTEKDMETFVAAANADLEKRTFSDFIRNATPEEKETVYTEVMQKASKAQQLTIETGCQLCGYDCAGANPPIAACPRGRK